MHMFEHNFARVFEESARLDMFRIYYFARQNTAFERRFNDTSTESISGAHMHKSFLHKFLQTFKLRDIYDQ